MITRVVRASLRLIQSFIRRLCRSRLHLSSTSPGLASHSQTQARYPDFPQIVWTCADDTAAQAEGWSLCQIGNTLQIRPIQQPADTQLTDTPDALAYVATRAAGESERHERALNIHAGFAADQSERLLAMLRSFLAPPEPTGPTFYIQRAQRSVKRFHWLADHITVFLLRHQEVLDIPALEQDSLEPTPYQHLLTLLEHLTAFHKDEANCATQFVDSQSPYCTTLLATFCDSFQYLLRREAIGLSASATWCYLTLALIAGLREATSRCGGYTITSWPTKLQFESPLHVALQTAFAAAENSGHPAHISYGGAFTATIMTRQPS